MCIQPRKHPLASINQFYFCDHHSCRSHVFHTPSRSRYLGTLVYETCKYQTLLLIHHSLFHIHICPSPLHVLYFRHQWDHWHLNQLVWFRLLDLSKIVFKPLPVFDLLLQCSACLRSMDWKDIPYLFLAVILIFISLSSYFLTSITLSASSVFIIVPTPFDFLNHRYTKTWTVYWYCRCKYSLGFCIETPADSRFQFFFWQVRLLLLCRFR